MPRRKTLRDYLAGGMGTARDVRASRAWAERQRNERGMGLARDVRAGQAQGWQGRGRKRRMRTGRRY